MNEKQGYQEDHTAINWKIFWLLLINLVGAAGLLYEYKTDFQTAKLVVGLTSAFFLIVYNVHHYYTAWFCPNTFYRGSLKDGKKSVWLTSHIRLPEAVYELTILEGRTGKELCKSAKFIGDWIHVDDFVDVKSLINDLESFKLVPAHSE